MADAVKSELPRTNPGSGRAGVKLGASGLKV